MSDLSTIQEFKLLLYKLLLFPGFFIRLPENVLVIDLSESKLMGTSFLGQYPIFEDGNDNI